MSSREVICAGFGTGFGTDSCARKDLRSSTASHPVSWTQRSLRWEMKRCLIDRRVIMSRSTP
jgi:hypothetical protein